MYLIVAASLFLLFVVLLWTMVTSNKSTKMNVGKLGQKIDTKFIDGRYDVDRKGIVNKRNV